MRRGAFGDPFRGAARGLRAKPALGDAQAYDGLIACGRAAIWRIDPGNTLEGRPFHTTTIHESHERHTCLPSTKSRGARGILSVAAAKRVAVLRDAASTIVPSAVEAARRWRGRWMWNRTIKHHLAASSSGGIVALAQAVVG